jgi:hypothetical protein
MTGFGEGGPTASVDFYEWLFAHGRHRTRVKITRVDFSCIWCSLVLVCDIVTLHGCLLSCSAGSSRDL